MTGQERADVRRRLFLLRQGWRRKDGWWRHPATRGVHYADDDAGLAAAEREARRTPGAS